MDRNYPILKDDQEVLPKCIVCERYSGEPGEFYVLESGAILHTDQTRQLGGPDDLMSGYLKLIKHGAEPYGPFVTLDLVSDYVGGQADLMFCSSLCLRHFLNRAVDDLEQRWNTTPKNLNI